MCGGELVAKKGELRNDHWAHINGRKCDDWYEPKGEWHRSWQGLFPKECQEVAVIDEQSGQRHIADIRTSDGLVIECQYSHLSRQEIEERERFYGEMVWLVSGTRLVYDRSRFQPLMDREYIEKSEMSGLYPYIVIPEHGYPHSIEDYVNRFWAHCKKPVFFDFEGKFNEPCQENDLYCLLPDVYNGCRIVAKIPHWDFVDEFNGPDAWEYVKFGTIVQESAEVLNDSKTIFTTDMMTSTRTRLASFSTGLEGASLTIFENGSWAKQLLGWGDDEGDITFDDIRVHDSTHLDTNGIFLKTYRIKTGAFDWTPKGFKDNGTEGVIDEKSLTIRNVRCLDGTPINIWRNYQ